MNRTRLVAQLRRHEGVKLTPYRCPAGKLTIGVGRNLDDVGITEDEALVLLDNDVTRLFQECQRHLPTFGSLCEARQHVLMDMSFNLGVAGLLEFRKMLAAVEAADFDRAAAEMLDSRWARQVGERAVTLAKMMREGVSL
jgi:lysozyme